jgi:hypothetical protein
LSVAAESELERLARLLRCRAGDLGFLARFAAVEIRALRLAVFARMYADHETTYSRIASASRLLPMRVTAPLAQRMLPARVSAGVVASLPADQAAAMSARMSADYVADVSGFLHPVLSAPVLSRFPADVIVRVAAVLADREDYDTMAEIVSALSDEQVEAVVDAIEDPAVLVQVALRVTDPNALQHLTGIIPEARLREMVVWARRRTRLWPELVALLGRLPTAQRKRLLSAARAS